MLSKKVNKLGLMPRGRSVDSDLKTLAGDATRAMASLTWDWVKKTAKTVFIAVVVSSTFLLLLGGSVDGGDVLDWNDWNSTVLPRLEEFHRRQNSTDPLPPPPLLLVRLHQKSPPRLDGLLEILHKSSQLLDFFFITKYESSLPSVLEIRNLTVGSTSAP